MDLMRVRIAAAWLAASAITLSLAGPVSAQQPAPANDQAAPVRYSAQQFFETTSFSMASPDGIAFSADGRSLLINSDASGVFNLYLLPVAGGEPTALTRSPDHAFNAESFFPDGERVLYSADQGGNELDHLYVRMADGTVRDLTPGDNLKAEFHGFSADGRTFFVATTERHPEMFDVYAYDAQTYERRLVFRNEGFLIGDVARDGRHVALIKAHSSANSDVYLAEIGAAGEPRLITEHQGNVAYDVYGFTPDGRALVYGTNEAGEWQQAWSYDLAAGTKRPMIEAEWDVMFVMH